MSHHDEPSRHDGDGTSLAPMHAHVFEAALHAGRKAGRKAAKQKLKRAAKHGGIELSKPMRKAVLRDAEKAAGRAAFAAATKALRKSTKRPVSMPVPGMDEEDAWNGVPLRPFTAGDSPIPAKRKHSGSQLVLDVLRTEMLSPGMVRVVAGGGDFAEFRSNGAADQHVKIHFANPALGLVPPYDMRSLRSLLPREDLPVSRSYTIRWHDPVARELAIDFVIHGTDGVAGVWAASAQPGDPLVMSKPSGKFRPDPGAEAHLYAGDETALPAIAAALEMLPGHARGKVFIEVDTAEERQHLVLPQGMELTWLYREGEPSASSTLLVDALRSIPAPHGRVEILAHGERSAMQDIRRLVSHWDIEQRRIQVSSYWTAGREKRKFREMPEQMPVMEAG